MADLLNQALVVHAHWETSGVIRALRSKDCPENQVNGNSVKNKLWACKDFFTNTSQQTQFETRGDLILVIDAQGFIVGENITSQTLLKIKFYVRRVLFCRFVSLIVC